MTPLALVITLYEDKDAYVRVLGTFLVYGEVSQW